MLLWGDSGAGVCEDATYLHRIDDPKSFNFCAVPRSAYDAFLFSGLAILLSCLLHFSSLSAVLVLLAGGLFEAFVYPFNLGRLGNAFTLWLGIDPPELFFYAFLPPLLLDSALAIDFFLFKKVMLQVLVFATLVVLGCTALMTPFLLHLLRLVDSGWTWQHGALFSAMLAPTDALAIAAILKKVGGPEALTVLMEGESLLNDASGIVLFDLFRGLVRRIAREGGATAESLPAVLPGMALTIARLALGGMVVGLALGWVTKRLLRLLRWHGALASQEVATILAMGYLAFYLANAPLEVSGVVAVAVFGLYGNATSHFELGSSARMKDLLAVQSTVSFSLNGIVFFFSGASAINFLYRSGDTLAGNWLSMLRFPAIFCAMFAARALCISAFNPFFQLLGAGSLPLPAVLFTSWGGLRGGVSLIMAQAVVTDDVLAGKAGLITAQMGLWTSMFVLTTLLLNAPTIPWLLRKTKLVVISPVQHSIRDKARRALLRYTKAAIEDLKADEDEMLRGVDWGAVASYVDLASELQSFNPGGGSCPPHPAPILGPSPWPKDAEEAGEPLHARMESKWGEEGVHGRRRYSPAAPTHLSHPAPLAASRRLLGASRTSLSHKWTPRAGLGGAGEFDTSLDAESWGSPTWEDSGGGFQDRAGGSLGGGGGDFRPLAELEEPLLSPISPFRDVTSPPGLLKLESRGFEQECPFTSATAPAPQNPPPRCASEPFLDVPVITVVNREGSFQGSGSSEEDSLIPPASSELQSAVSAPPAHQESGAQQAQRAPLALGKPAGEGNRPGSRGILRKIPHPGGGIPSHPGFAPLDLPMQAEPSPFTFLQDSFPSSPSSPRLAPSSLRPPESTGPTFFAPPFCAPPCGVSLPPGPGHVPAVPSPRFASAAAGGGSWGRVKGSAMGRLEGRCTAAGGSTADGGAARGDRRLGPPSPRALQGMQGQVRSSLLPVAPDRQAVCHVSELLSEYSAAGTDPGAAPPASTGCALLEAAGTQLGRGGGAALPHLNQSHLSSGGGAGRGQGSGVMTQPLPLARLREGASAQHAQRIAQDRVMPASAHPPPKHVSFAPVASGEGGKILGGCSPGSEDLSIPQLATLPPIHTSPPGSTWKASVSQDTSDSQEPHALSGPRPSRPIGEMGGAHDPCNPGSPSSMHGRLSAVVSSHPQGSLQGGDRLEASEQPGHVGSSLPPRPAAPHAAHTPLPAMPPLNVMEAAQKLPFPSSLTAPNPLHGSGGWNPSPQASVGGGSGRNGPSDSPPAGDSHQDSQMIPVHPPVAAPGPPRLARASAPARAGSTYEAAHTDPPPSPRDTGSGRLPAAWPAAQPPSAQAPSRRWQPVAGTRYRPWRAGGRSLLGRSMSSPLLGEAAGGNGAGVGETGTAFGSSQTDPTAYPGPVPSWGQEVEAEARSRLVAGLKRYFHAKRGEGLLSLQGLRILDYACDMAADRAAEPLSIWVLTEREVVGGCTVRVLAWLFYKLKRMAGGVPRPLTRLLRPPLRFMAGLIGGVLSRVMLVACEVAVEYWMALTWSPQVEWMREAQHAGALQGEIAAETQRVCKFIVDREIEAPERFQAIQSYRAAMAILRQQEAFAEKLYDSGVINRGEAEALQDPISNKIQRLQIRGPSWRAPSVIQVLRSLPFLHSVPEHIFQFLVDRGQLLEYTQGDVIWQGAEPFPPHASHPPHPPYSGLFGSHSQSAAASQPSPPNPQPRPPSPAMGLSIVIYGLVRSSFRGPQGEVQEYYLGSGGVVGLLSALVGAPLAGTGPAVAEANALRKGPAVFHLPQSTISLVRRRAAAGDRHMQQLELDLFRVAALYVMERLKSSTLAEISAAYRELVVWRAKWRGIHRAARAGGRSPPRGSGPLSIPHHEGAPSGLSPSPPRHTGMASTAAEELGTAHARGAWGGGNQAGLHVEQLGGLEEEAERLGREARGGGFQRDLAAGEGGLQGVDGCGAQEQGLDGREAQDVELEGEEDWEWGQEAVWSPLGGAGLQHVLLTDEEVLRSLDAQRVWHDAHAFARKVLAAARVQLRDGELLALGPGQRWRQACHAVLLHGELTLRPHARRGNQAQHRVQHGPGWAPHTRSPNKPVASPAVLPFLAASLDSALPVLGHIRGMGVASTACSYVGGGEGAILVLCPPSVESPTDSASESSTVNGEATRHGRGAQHECSDGGHAQGEPVLRPLGHPLRRTRSRRLPLSSALSGMESLQP